MTLPGLARLLALFSLSLPACGDDSTGGSGTTGDDAGGPDSGALPDEIDVCDGLARHFDLPSQPGARGPWPVGSRAVRVADLDAEIWYPALPGSEVGETEFVYDLRKYLPPEQQATVTDANTIQQRCECQRDLPLDTERGPYPIVLFVHGFSGFSGQSLEQMTHWASRGFVVVSADHPSIGLKTFLTDGIGGFASGTGSQAEEAVRLLAAIRATAGDLAFLDGHVDPTRMAVAGHSAGGGSVGTLSSEAGVRVVAPMAMRGVVPGSSVQSSLVIGGMTDQIVPYAGTQAGYETSPAPKRLVGLAAAGHMAFTSFCPIGRGQGGILAAAQTAGVVFAPEFLAIVEPLAADGCGPENLATERGWEVINTATAAAFEETLLCMPERATVLSDLPRSFPDAVGEYLEAL